MEFVQWIVDEPAEVLLSRRVVNQTRGLHEWAYSTPGEKSPAVDGAETVLRYGGAVGIAEPLLQDRLAADGLTTSSAAALLSGRRVDEGVDSTYREVESEVDTGVECLGPDLSAIAERAAEVASAKLSDRMASETVSHPAGLDSAVRWQARNDVERLLSHWELPLPDMNETPVLARRIGAIVLRLVDDAVRVSLATMEDAGAVADRWGIDLRHTSVRETMPCVGDPHDGRRRSWVLTSGRHTLYFKQRDLRLDLWYEQFVAWFDSDGDALLRAVEVVPTGSRGWALGAENRQVASANLSRFYYRYGALVAVLTFLGATDIHSSNVVIDGEFPVPVDLECLFHPRRITTFDADSPTANLARLLAEGPMRTGLLPARLPTTDGQGIDVSALGGPHDLGDRRSAVWSEGALVNAADFLADLLSGYRTAMKRLADRVGELRLPDSFFKSVDGVAARYIHRDTAVYRRLLDAADAPRWHRTGIDRSVALDRLWTVAGHDPVCLTTASVACMFRDDIPRFQIAVGSDVVEAPGISCRLEVEAQGPDAALSLLRDRSRSDSVDEAALIASVSGLRSRPIGDVAVASAAPILAQEVVDRGIALLRSGVRTDSGWTWMVTSHVSGRWQVGPAEGNLYDGLPGTVMAFDALAHADPDGPWSEVVNDVVKTVLYDWVALSERDRGVAPFASVAGASMYVAATCRSIDDPLRNNLLDRAMPAVVASLGNETSCDFMSGLPGLIRGASSANQLLGLGLDGELSDAVQRLLALELTGTERGSWPTYHGRAIQGLAHGVSGVLLALTAVSSVLAESSLVEAVNRGLSFERRSRDPERGGWFDLRVGPSAIGELPAAWCNGAAGIGMVRQELESASGLDLADDLAHAVAAASNTIRARDDALCHGWFGSKLLLTRTGGLLPFPSHAPLLRPAEPGPAPTAGLMLGSAGLIYTLAQAMRPDVVADVLTLSGPQAVQ